MKPSGPGLLFAGRFLITVSISVLVMCLLRFSVSSWFSFGRASLVAQRLKHLPPMQRPRFDPWVGKIPWRRKWQSTPVFLPEGSHGQRSLVGYSPRGLKEPDTTERLHLTSTLCFNIQFQKNFQSEDCQISNYIPPSTTAVTCNTLEQVLYLWYLISLSTWIR